MIRFQFIQSGAQLIEFGNADVLELVGKHAAQFGGHYVVQRIDGGAYVDVRKLSRDEAMTYRTASGEVLRLEWERKA